MLFRSGGGDENEGVPDRVLERQGPPDVEHDADRVQRSADGQQPQGSGLKGRDHRFIGEEAAPPVRGRLVGRDWVWIGSWVN